MARKKTNWWEDLGYESVEHVNDKIESEGSLDCWMQAYHGRESFEKIKDKNAREKFLKAFDCLEDIEDMLSVDDNDK